MALPLAVDSLDSVPESIRSEYIEDNGKYRLVIDGYEDPKNLKSALEKERQSAREAAKAKAELERKFEGIDIEEYQTLKQEREALEEARLKAEGKADELAQKRTEKILEESKKKELAAQSEIERYKAIAKRSQDEALSGKIQSAAAGKIHQDPKALELVAMMAKQIFTIDEENRVVQLDSEGHVILGKDGRTPFTPAEWIESLRETHPFLFPNSNTGGGASGSKGYTSGSKVITRASFDAKPAHERAALARTHTIVD